MSKNTSIAIPSPDLQIDFSFALEQLRKSFLQEGLKETVATLPIADIDKELSAFVPSKFLSILACRGLRGELVFPVPCLFLKNPRLLGYYRLLLGFSQKAFFSGELGLSPFKSMEEKGSLSATNEKNITALCEALIDCACKLISGLGAERLTQALLDDLTLLTLGPQLRGGHNVKVGTAGIVRVFEVIHKIVKSRVLTSNPSKIEIKNAAGRIVKIEFSSDPDIIIREAMTKKEYRNIIAIEIKAGTDFSNIHNRIGEAEKSHQKARQAGFVECWTVVNVDRVDIAMAKKESPSTNRFYRISELEKASGEEFQDFKNRVIGLTGIPQRKK